MSGERVRPELADRFRPVFDKIADGALDREADRRLPHDEVNWLREAGFTAVRVPEEYGGGGASLPEFFALLMELGRADSNLPQLLRGHAGFVETRLTHPDAVVRDRWLRRIADGVIVGNAQSELGNRSFWENATTISGEDGDRRLDGRKFYSTGSLFADWIHTTATVDTTHSATVLVPATAPGVHRLDDWDGFGQRLTGSGTTLFEGVAIHPEDVEPYDNGALPSSYLAAFFQLVHLATLAGIGRAAVAETAAFVRQRSRNLLHPEQSRPAQDPQVQQVVGRLAGASFAADAIVLAAADALEQVSTAVLDGRVTPDDFDRADVAVFGAQGQVIELVLRLTTDLFEVGGASAVTDRFRLDRHWRNARTLASHNPVIYRDRIVGEYVLTGASPSGVFTRSWDSLNRKDDS